MVGSSMFTDLVPSYNFQYWCWNSGTSCPTLKGKAEDSAAPIPKTAGVYHAVIGYSCMSGIDNLLRRRSRWMPI